MGEDIQGISEGVLVRNCHGQQIRDADGIPKRCPLLCACLRHVIDPAGNQLFPSVAVPVLGRILGHLINQILAIPLIIPLE